MNENPCAVGYTLSGVLTVLSIFIQCVYFVEGFYCLWIHGEKRKPRINANLWRIAFRYPNSHTSCRRVRGIRQRSAKRLTRASGARSIIISLALFSVVFLIRLRAPEARVKRSAERWRLAIRDATMSRVEVSEGNGTRLAKPEGRDSR